jgi:tetratricopeptide (TPR) repeat protein
MLRIIRAYLLYTWGGLHRYFGNKDNLPREHERAAHYFARAHQLHPGMVQARLARAIILWRELDRSDEAIADLTALLQDDPAYAMALFNRALAYQQAGRYALALADLEAFLALNRPGAYRQTAAGPTGSAPVAPGASA